MEDVEVTTIGRLDSDDETLILSSFTRLAALVVPDRQVLQVFVSHVGVFRVLRVREDLLFLLFELFDQTVNVGLDLNQRFSVIDDFQIAITPLWIDVFQWV